MFLDLKIALVWDDELFKGTLGACVTKDGELWIHPRIYLQQSDDDKLAIICHEICHVLRMDFIRARNKNAYLWNVVADAFIHHWFEQTKLHIPTGGITLTSIEERAGIKIDREKDSTESVYEKLRSKKVNARWLAWRDIMVGDVGVSDIDTDKESKKGKSKRKSKKVVIKDGKKELYEKGKESGGGGELERKWKDEITKKITASKIAGMGSAFGDRLFNDFCLLYTSPSPRDRG